MKTRTGKIARLPKPIREQLNARLENGEPGTALVTWLNQLPEVQKIITDQFAGLPIRPQNLSEWRQGGYQDWLRHQQREQRVQRIVEEGASLGHIEGSSDLFENCARMALAEWLTDMDALHEFRGEERSKRLRALNIDLARLQNAWNRSSWAALAWVKWNERFLGPDDYQNNHDQEPTETPTPLDSPNPVVEPAVSPNSLPQAVDTTETSVPAHAPESENITETPEFKPDQAISPREEERVYLRRPIYHHQGCGHLCRQCHPDASAYPYAEALKDSIAARDYGAQCFWRGRTMIITQPTECSCPCHECAPPPPISRVSPILEVEVPAYNPCADFLRQAALRKSVIQ